MNKKKRHKIILNEAHIYNRSLFTDLAGQLNASIDTARRDVEEVWSLLNNTVHLKKLYIQTHL